MRTMRAQFFAVAALLCGLTDAVQVYILMGQSNMLGMAPLLDKKGENRGGYSLERAVTKDGSYQYLWDAKMNDWAVNPTVRNVGVAQSGNHTFGESRLQHNEWMTVNATVKSTLGPELGIGWTLGNASSEPILILKSCTGGRSLGWDLLPPGSPEQDFTDSTGKTYTYAGYHESPEKWVKGSTPKPIGWQAGEQYDGDTANAAYILAHLDQFYPGAKEYEIKGFFWWQGAKDAFETGLSTHYETNLVRLIKTLRTQFKAPNAKFVAGTLGQTVSNATTGNDGLIYKAIFAADGKSGKYPEFKGNVAGVYTHPYSMGGQAASHYGYDARTYMNVGQALGAKMVALLKADKDVTEVIV